MKLLDSDLLMHIYNLLAFGLNSKQVGTLLSNITNGWSSTSFTDTEIQQRVVVAESRSTDHVRHCIFHKTAYNGFFFRFDLNSFIISQHMMILVENFSIKSAGDMHSYRERQGFDCFH